MRATLKKYEDFKFCLSSGIKQNLNTLVVCYIQRDELFLHLQNKGYPRADRYNQNEFLFGVLVSKKLGKAVKRNYFKRVVRSALDSTYNSLISKGFKNEFNTMQKKYCFVFLPNIRKAETITHQNVYNDLSYFFKKISR